MDETKEQSKIAEQWDALSTFRRRIDGRTPTAPSKDHPEKYEPFDVSLALLEVETEFSPLRIAINEPLMFLRRIGAVREVSIDDS